MYIEKKHDFEKLSYKEKEEFLNNMTFEELEDFYLFEIDRCNNNERGDFTEEDRAILEEAILINYDYEDEEEEE